MLRGRGIQRSYDGEEVLRSVDIDVRPGSTTILIGPSGSGKTTLLRCLSFLDYPEAGTISVDAESYSFPLPTSKASLPEPWPDLTVVFQQHFLWPHLTLRQNIMLPLSNGRGLAGSDLESLFRRFDMLEFLDRFPNEASVGQRQRTAIVRALALEPKYILLDEITSALDVEQVRVILTQVLELEKRGIGVLLITHQLGLARGLLSANDKSEVVLLDDGEVVERGGLGILDSPIEQRTRDFVEAMRLGT